MKNALLIAERSESYYFEPFIEPCAKLGVQIYVLDSSLFPDSASICLSMEDSAAVSGFVDVLEWRPDSVFRTRLALADISVAWHLRDSVLTPPSNECIDERFAANETRAALSSLASILQCPWVNRKEDVHSLLSNKLYQQVIARSCGLSVPRTLVSNDSDRVAAFSDIEDGLLLKSLGYMRLDDNGRYFLYSERFSHNDLLTARSAIRACPIFAQQYVEKRYEHRVMVIGSRVLTCRIDSQASERTRVDWRHYDFKAVSHKAIDLPREVEHRLMRFMEKARLRFGAIDLIETPDGDYVFLEVNPTGQWGWIAELAGLPIPEAVADMLAAI